MYIGPFYFDTKELFEKYPEIKLVYLFGSWAEGKAGPMSDYDLFKTNQVDIVVLNDDVGSFLKYQAIRGKLIYSIEPYKIIVEPQILSEYFDFQVFSKKHNL